MLGDKYDGLGNHRLEDLIVDAVLRQQILTPGKRRQLTLDALDNPQPPMLVFFKNVRVKYFKFIKAGRKIAFG